MCPVGVDLDGRCPECVGTGRPYLTGGTPRFTTDSQLQKAIVDVMASRQTTRRSYGQHCAIAHALDLVGERWTLLILRELLLGPLRYTDLLEGLPGIGTNLLARRLQDLEESAIIERQILPRPASATVYTLTRQGEALEPAIVALGRFGGRFLPGQPGPEEFRPRWAVIGLKHTFRPDHAPSEPCTYQLHLNGEQFHVRVENGRLIARQGAATDPDLIIHTSARELLELLGGRRPIREALRSSIEAFLPGSRGESHRSRAKEVAALTQFVAMFGWGTARHTTPARSAPAAGRAGATSYPAGAPKQ
jgi:DNA-binding HxlR family transcriptional regulator